MRPCSTFVVAVALTALSGARASAEFSVSFAQPSYTIQASDPRTLFVDARITSDQPLGNDTFQGFRFQVVIDNHDGDLVFQNFTAADLLDPTKNALIDPNYVFFGKSDDVATSTPLGQTAGNFTFMGSDQTNVGGLHPSVPLTNSNGNLLLRLKLLAGTPTTDKTYTISFVTDPDPFLTPSGLRFAAGDGVIAPSGPFVDVSTQVTVKGGATPPNSVPVPASLLLGLIGVPFAGATAWRRRRSAPAA